MTILYAHMITRPMLRANPEARFVFGDNDVRRGLGGQAKEMRGEPNAIGVATKWRPGSERADYFQDPKEDDGASLEVLNYDLDRVEEALKQGRLVVIPRAGIGTGLSEMESRCPKLFDHLQHRLKILVAIHGLCNDPNPLR